MIIFCVSKKTVDHPLCLFCLYDIYNSEAESKAFGVKQDVKTAVRYIERAVALSFQDTDSEDEYRKAKIDLIRKIIQ